MWVAIPFNANDYYMKYLPPGIRARPSIWSEEEKHELLPEIRDEYVEEKKRIYDDFAEEKKNNKLDFDEIDDALDALLNSQEKGV